MKGDSFLIKEDLNVYQNDQKEQTEAPHLTTKRLLKMIKYFTWKFTILDYGSRLNGGY